MYYIHSCKEPTKKTKPPPLSFKKTTSCVFPFPNVVFIINPDTDLTIKYFVC